MTHQTPYEGENRRKNPRTRDGLYRIAVMVNILAWVIFLVAMIVFHYARPELISGVQAYWGVEGRIEWSQTLSFYLLLLLGLCTSVSVGVLIMRKRRNRRKNDYFGVNAVILLAITLASLVWIIFEMQQG